MKAIGIISFILAGGCLLGGNLIAVFLFSALGVGFIFASSSNKEKTDVANTQSHNIEKLKETFDEEKKEKNNADLEIAKRTKILMEEKGLRILEAKAQAEMEYLLDSEKQKNTRSDSLD